MIELFYMGSPVFMGTLTLIFLVVLAMAVYRAVKISRNEIEHETTFRHNLTYIKSVGLFALVFGILAQLIGMYQAFSVIEVVGDISPSILAGGLKVSMITTIYGMVIFLMSYLIWWGLDYMTQKSLAH